MFELERLLLLRKQAVKDQEQNQARLQEDLEYWKARATEQPPKLEALSTHGGKCFARAQDAANHALRALDALKGLTNEGVARPRPEASSTVLTDRSGMSSSRR